MTTSTLTRVAFLGAVALLAGLLVVSARTEPQATDARLGRHLELLELIRAEQARVDALTARVEELSRQVAEYEQLDSEEDPVAELQAEVNRVAAHAGMVSVAGPGTVVTLKDSGLADSPTGDPNDLVIHEQDLQAVINALWAGGAEAMAVNGQRVLATTAIRCVGNTLLLHGSVHSPPYVIEAIGDPVAIDSALERDPAVARFREQVTAYELGFEVVAVEDMVVPGFEGISAMQVARPAESAEGS